MKKKLSKMFKRLAKGTKIAGRVTKRGIGLGGGMIQKRLESAGKKTVNQLLANAEKGVGTKKFKEYSDKYHTLKLAGKAAGKGKSQQPYSGIPNLKLTGTMLNNLNYKIDSKGLDIGWFSGTEVKKVVHNKMRKKGRDRVLFDDKIIPKNVTKILDDELRGVVNLGLRKATWKIKVRVGT